MIVPLKLYEGGTLVGLLDEFKAFIMRGNVVELAVAFVIGAAFKAVVDAFVADLVTPLIAAIGGQQDFSSLDFTINDSVFRYGDFLNQVIAFLLIAAVIFFFVVKPMNMLMQRMTKEPPADPSLKKCPECLSDIAAEARRCPYCTTQLAGA
jgi:large conductance mechanosensitive channel